MVKHILAFDDAWTTPKVDEVQHKTNWYKMYDEIEVIFISWIVTKSKLAKKLKLLTFYTIFTKTIQLYKCDALDIYYDKTFSWTADSALNGIPDKKVIYIIKTASLRQQYIFWQNLLNVPKITKKSHIHLTLNRALSTV